MTKDKFIQFIIDLVFMSIIFCAVEFIFYKLKIISSINFASISGFLTGWSIFRIVKLINENKKVK